MIWIILNQMRFGLRGTVPAHVTIIWDLQSLSAQQGTGNSQNAKMIANPKYSNAAASQYHPCLSNSDHIDGLR